MSPHPLTNFEIQDYFKNKPKFKGVFSKDNLPKTIKNDGYIINLQNNELGIGTHWIALYVKNNEVVCFDSYGVEHIAEEIKKFIGSKTVKLVIYRTQHFQSIICGYFSILFLEHMFKGKTINDFTNLFSPWDFKKNDEIVSRFFK